MEQVPRILRSTITATLVTELKALIDTELWSFAKKRPVRDKFPSEGEFKAAMKIHETAVSFFRDDFPSLKVYMSYHQLAEIFHVLAFRGTKLPLKEALSVINGIIEDPSIVKVPVTMEALMKAIKESAETGIHVWDFLCFLPVSNMIEVVYSADPHFKVIGERYGVKVINPLGQWIGP